jgi:hypothetical protein
LIASAAQAAPAVIAASSATAKTHNAFMAILPIASGMTSRFLRPY